MQIDPNILKESPDLAKVQANFTDVNAQNVVPTVPQSPANPIPASEDPLDALIRQTTVKAGPNFSVQVSELPNASRYPVVLPQTNYEELYAQSQGTLNKWGNALVKMGGIAASTFIQGTFGTINGVIKASQDGKLSSFYDNEFSRGLDEFNQANENRFPNYYTEAEKNASWYSPTNLLTANFWADKVVKNLGYVAGAAGSGLAWTRALQAARIFSNASSIGKMVEATSALEDGISTVPQLQKLSAAESALQAVATRFNASRTTLDRTQRFISAGLATTSESAMEALQGLNSFRAARIQEYIEQYGTEPVGEDLDAINQQAESVGNWTLAMNTALLTASNYIQFPKILGSNYPVEKATFNNGIKDIQEIVFDQATNKFIKAAPSTRAGKILKGVQNVSSYFFAPTEAIEEASQFAIGVGTEDYFNKKYRGEQIDFFSALGEGVKETLTTKEGIESILIGGLSGGAARNISPTNFLGQIKERRELANNTAQALSAFNNATFNGYIKDSIDSFNRSITLQEQRANAIKNSERFDAGDLEVDYLHNYLQPRIKYGRFDLIKDDIDNYKRLASTAEGFEQLKQEQLIPLDAQNSLDFINKLNEVESYANSMREMYKNLNLRYSGQINENKERLYSDEVIDKMVYATSKIINYDKTLPSLINPVLAAGVNVQPILDSIENSGRPSESTVRDAINQINNLNVLSDVKEDIKDSLRDSIEATLRRRKFMKDYENLKKSPRKYTTPQVGMDDLVGRTVFTVPQANNTTTDLELGKSYPTGPNFERQENNITTFPSMEVLGETPLGELNVRFPNGQTRIVDPNDLADFTLTNPDNPNRPELERRFQNAMDGVLTSDEFKDLNLPTGDLQSSLGAVNNSGNTSLIDAVEKAFQDVEKQFNEEQEQLEELRKNKEKMEDLEKEFDAEDAPPTNPPGPDNTVTTKVNQFNNFKKSIGDLFSSTTAPEYQVTTPNDNFHRRTNKFLNDLDIIPDRDQIQTLLVTVSNQDSLGLSGLIPELIPDGSKTPNTDIDKGTIHAVFVKGEDFIGVDGNSIGKIGEPVNLNELLYQTLSDDSLTFRNKKTRYITADENPKTGATEEEAEEAQDDWRYTRSQIMSYPDPLRYDFQVSRGIPNVPETPQQNSPVGILVTEEDLSKPLIKILTTETSKSGNIRMGTIPHNGKEYKYPLGRPLIQTDSILYQLNNRKFTPTEVQTNQELIANLYVDGKFNEGIFNYLKGIFYFSTPQNNPALNQIWFEDGFLYLGNRNVREPLVKDTLLNSQALTDFLTSLNFNVNVGLSRANAPFTEYTSPTQTKEWTSYQHFLISPEGGRETPLYVNLVDPATSSDPYTAPFDQKYVTLEDFAVPEIADEPSDIPQIEPTEEEIDNIEDNTSDELMNDGGDVFLQMDEPSPASEDTLLKLNMFLSSLGVSVETLPQIVVNGIPIEASGLANPLNKLIQVVEGKENVALPEEAMHIAVELIEQQNPALFNRMLSRIESYKLYRDTFNTYKNSPFYQTNGKPDVRKLKKETIGKVLAETVIRKNEGSTEKPQLLEQAQSWWQEILQFFKDLFFGNPFEQTVGQVLNNQLINSDLPTQESVYLQLDPDQRVEFSRLVDASTTVTRSGNEYTVNGQKVKNTITGIVEEIYDNLYANKTIDKTQYDELVANERTFKNDDLHKELGDMMNRLVDDDGFVRGEELAKGNSQLPTEVYNTFYDNLKQRLSSFPSGSRFIYDVNIYDSVKDRAATVDVIVLNPDGKIDLIDFRQIQLDEDEKIPNPIRKASQERVDTYQSILASGYNIPTNLIRQRRTIPVVKTEDGIEMGAITEKEKNTSLQPIISRSETTGNAEIDSYIQQLNDLIEQQLNTASEKGQEYVKYEQIADLISSVRNLQLYNSGAKLVATARKDIERINKYFNRYRKILNSGDQEAIKALKVNDLSGQILNAVEVLDIYSNLMKLYPNNFGDKSFGGSKNKAEKVVGEALSSKEDLKKLSVKLRTDVIARGFNIQDFFKPEKVVSLYSGWIRSLSQSPTKAGQILWKIVNKMTNAAAIEYAQEYEKLKDIAKGVTDTAKAKGISVDEQFKRILQVDSKGRWNGSLISEISDDFYASLSKAIEDEDVKWIKDNIDQDAYRTWYEAELQTRINNQIETKYDVDETEDRKKKKAEMDRFKAKFDLFSEDFKPSKSNYKLKSFPKKDAWKSKEYAAIEKDAPLLAFYNYFQERNELAYKQGMIKSWQAKTFVPNIRKGITERVTFGTENHGNKSTDLSLFNGIRVSVDDEAFGYLDKKTGDNKDRLFAMYTYDLGQKTTDKDGEEFRNYAGKSSDLFKSLSLWNQEIIKYKYASEVENTLNLLHLTETTKQSIAKNRTGGILRKKGTNEPEVVENNIENSQYLKDYIDYYLYGKKLKAGTDVTFKFKYNALANAVNKVVDIMPVSAEDEITISGRKMLQQANRWFSLKVLGINLASAGSNLFGGTANAFIQQGKYFTSADIAKGQLKIASAKFTGEEGKKYAGLINAFSVLVTDTVNDTSRSLSVSNFTKILNSDTLMYLQRSSDYLVQAPVAVAFFENTMIENGELVNIREYVKNANNYSQKFELPTVERNALDAKIEKEIETLKNERSLPKVVQVVNDKLVIPGIDLQSDTVYDLRNRVQQYTKDIIGNMSPEDTARYRMTILGQSFMMFKNWIPRMADVRFSELRFNVGTDAYEWGRMRMLANAVKHNWRSAALDVVSVLVGKEDGVIKIAKQAYFDKKQQFEEANGAGSFTMGQAEFIDAYIRGIRGSLQELAGWTVLAGMLFAAKAFAPDKDEDENVKGLYKWTVRYIDKINGELSFFYNPMSYLKLSEGNIFPALGIAQDVLNITSATGAELWYGITGDEDGMEKNKVARYVFKALPIGKELTTYAAMFNDDIAKSLGVKVPISVGR